MTTQRHPVDIDKVIDEAVVRKRTLTIRFWARVLHWAEGRWLMAHGWTRVKEDAWLLPMWHPHFKKATSQNLYFGTPGPFPNVWSAFLQRPQSAIPGTKEPYDQSHAINSQRLYSGKDQVPIRHVRRHKAPAFPPYLRKWVWMPALNVGALLLVSMQLTAGLHWSRHLFFLAAVLTFCVSLVTGWRARREWELDWAETQLDRRTTDGAKRPN
jgi:hypothetical protein